jgi:hypothetical protein
MAQTLLSIGAGTYSGTVTLPPTALPNGLANFLVSIGCASWTDPASSVAVSLELSQDGGDTWTPWSSAVLRGGSTDKMGNPLQTAELGISAPQGESLMVRGSAVITGNLVTTGITVVGS